jgi:feruloyl esterase
MFRRPSLLWTLALAFASRLAEAQSCQSLTHLDLAHASVTHAEIVPAGAALEFDSAFRSPSDPPPTTAIAFCRVQITSKPTPDSDIRIEVWTPVGKAWNGKLQQVGNGGFAGALFYPYMRAALKAGYAVAGTDDGHRAAHMTDADWALDHPEKIVDYGWRALYETAVIARRVVRAATARDPRKNYFFGCSDGGREALMMAQRYPTYFDGIVAGAPAASLTRLMASGAMRGKALSSHTAHLSAPQLAVLQRQALQNCGGSAGYLKDPAQCHLDLTALQCKGAATDSCLTEEQVKVAQILYAELREAGSGKPLYGAMPGAEALKDSWDFWLSGKDSERLPESFAFARNYLAYFVLKSPQLDLSSVSDQDIARGSDREFAAILDSDSGQLSAFKKHGGKLIEFQGWNDPVIAPGYALEYHQRLKKQVEDSNFYRLYMVPGMLHCHDGAAPTEVNWMRVMEDWVEKGHAPAELTARDGKGATQILHPDE